MTTEKLQTDWVKWNGGAAYPEIEFNQKIEYRTRGGFLSKRSCKSMLIWRHIGGLSDIVAYRVANPTTNKETP